MDDVIHAAPQDVDCTMTLCGMDRDGLFTHHNLGRVTCEVCLLTAESDDHASRMSELQRENALLRAALDHYWQYTVCPCGARRESPRTHPHAAGCPVGKALDA